MPPRETRTRTEPAGPRVAASPGPRGQASGGIAHPRPAAPPITRSAGMPRQIRLQLAPAGGTLGAMSGSEVLSRFHPVVARWFEARFAAPTAPQAAGWP